ncbi:hypothetical protein [Pontixanthobacter luteolus]|uniref:hypothetical protein n=1 Tax=Pontixanthobacter luteolus TaxID=295089 RepID=UPI002303C84E|nr:hypothetical protein [Pontixanthobacter luteolus]
MRGRAAILFIAAACFSAPLTAQDNFSKDFSYLQQQDSYLQSIGWKLVTSNAAFCDQTKPATGLLIQDAAGYGDPARVRAETGIGGDIFIHAVVPRSPAALAGIDAPEELTAIDGMELAALPLDEDRLWQRQLDIMAMIAASLAEDGTVELSIAGRPGPATITGKRACASRFELISGRSSVSTNGTRIAVGRDFVGLGYAEDEFAAALAHELAHNLLGHAGWLDTNGRGRRNVRKTEDEADRLMPWLLANAGYDPAAAVRFLERWGPKNGGGLFRKRTHSGWDERAEAVAAEIPRVLASQSRRGAADWKADFARIIALD